MTPVHEILCARHDLGFVRNAFRKPDDAEEHIRRNGVMLAEAVAVDISAVIPLIQGRNIDTLSGLSCVPPFRWTAFMYQLLDSSGAIARDGFVVSLVFTDDLTEERSPTRRTGGKYFHGIAIEDARWVLVANAWYVFDHKPVWIGLCCGVALDKNGSPIGRMVTTDPFKLRDEAKCDSFATSALKAPMIGCAMLNCRNTEMRTETDERNPTDRKLRSMKLPRIEFKKLIVEPTATRTAAPNGSEYSADDIALHICRGHFAHYSEDRPLFGRPGMHGQFWVPQHVRGKAENGMVLKDYAVKPR